MAYISPCLGPIEVEAKWSRNGKSYRSSDLLEVMECEPVHFNLFPLG
jgi:hypothetical protein